MNELITDLAFAWRSALKRPANSLLIVLTLALGIGVNSAMFSITYQVLLAPLPYEDGDRLVKLEQQAPRLGRFDMSWSGPTIEDFRAQGTAFSELAGYLQLPFTVAGAAEPRQVSAGVSDWNFLDVLGVQPLLGRAFTASDDVNGAAPVLLLAYDFWREQFAADSAVLGSTLMIKDIVYTVIGVLPQLPPWPHGNDIWIPAASDPYRLFAWTDGYDVRESSWPALVLGRLKDDISIPDAQRDADIVAARLATSYPDAYPEGYQVVLSSVQQEMAADSGATFLILSGLTVLVALIASANVASLNIANLAARNQELAIREAVGASPGRILRQVLTEQILLAGIGCALAIAVAWPALQLLKGFAFEFTPLASEIGMNAAMISFAMVVTLLMWLSNAAHLVFGTRDINRVLKEGGTKSTPAAGAAWRRQALLMLQFALALVVLSSATLMVCSLLNLTGQHSGYDAEQVVAVSLMIDVDFGEPEQKQAPYAEARPYYSAFSRTLLAELRDASVVEDAGLLAGVPLLQGLSYLGAVTFDIEGRTFANPADRATAPYHAATEGFFEALRIPLLQGRLFDATDAEDSLPVALINESFAHLYFPEGAALGQRVRFVGDSTWRTIVGVVGDLRSEGLDRVEGPSAYYNYWQYPTEVVSVYVKTSESPQALDRLVAGIVREIHPRQSVESVAPLATLQAQWLAPLSLRALLISLFGLLALLVTLSGVVGVVSNNVGQRVREIGVHMAVGANPGMVMGMFVFQGLKIYVCGLTLGLALTLSAAPLLEPLLYQTSVFNPGVYAAVILLLTLTVLLAIWLPARKAGTMSPVAALHDE